MPSINHRKKHNNTSRKVNAMFYMEVDFYGDHLRIEWNGSATFNIQVPIGGQWVDVECFTCYDVDNQNDAFNYSLDWMNENMMEDTE